jgi:dihydrofolate reductase
MSEPELVALVAVARNGVIGAGNTIPWRLSSDMKRFKALTMGKPLIVGRRTYQSFPRALPGRQLIVVTRDPAFAAPEAIVAANPHAALEAARAAARDMGAAEIVIGGGADIYRALMPQTRRIELTEVAIEPEGDAFFPAFDMSQWRETRREPQPRGPKDEADFTYVTLERTRTL